MFHLTDTRLRTPCEMPYQREHLTVNQGVTGSSPVGGAIKTLENTVFSRVFCYLARSERTSKNPIFKVSRHTHPNDC